MAYLDTSLLVAYYCPEPLSEAVQRTLDRISQPAISPLVELEFYSAVAAKLRLGGLTRAAAERILGMFRQHLGEEVFRFIPIETREYQVARDWIGGFTTALRAPDALHLAAAFTNKLMLLTCDRGLAKAAGQFKVKHRLIA